MATGPDISEHQRDFPDGAWDFVIIRTVNEAGREDKRWRAHKAEADRRGIPAGAYVITDPRRIGADELAVRFIATLRASSWSLIPTVDIELGPIDVGYHRAIRDLIRGAGYPAVMGYYSAGSTYRQRNQHLFDRQWLASWSMRPGSVVGADLHQFRGSPLDLNFAHVLGRIQMLGQAPPTPTPPAPTPGQPGDDDDMNTAEFDDQLEISLKGNKEIRTALMSIQADGLLYILRGNPEVREELKRVIREAVQGT